MYCPHPYRYAVMQMDPVGMISHFQDPIATAAAQAIRPKKYLVYLDYPVDLPSVTCKWFRYDVSLIGTTLRPEDSANGLTSDMVVPIFPNTSGPREPVRPYPSFPFPNCYHWLDCGLLVRIRRPEMRFDHSCSFHLETRQHFELAQLFMEDHARARRAVDERLAQDIPQPAGDACDANSESNAIEEAVIVDDGSLRNGRESSVGSVDSVSDAAYSSINSSYDSVDALFLMDPLGLITDDAVESIPLVDMWFELEEHLTVDTITNPMDVIEEVNTTVQIIRDARERAPSTKIPVNDSLFNFHSDSIRSVVPPIEEPTYAERMPSFIYQRILKISQLEVEQPAAKRANLTAKCPTIWRTLKRMVARMVHLPPRQPECAHPPFLPFWP
ncbi:hypothetical protein C2E23DRAFT_734382 [Lenzites betulinus]|nr:hypothetical protein C2E23DRAFT_734382 [Lenzites betulinus]